MGDDSKVLRVMVGLCVSCDVIIIYSLAMVVGHVYRQYIRVSLTDSTCGPALFVRSVL